MRVILVIFAAGVLEIAVEHVSLSDSQYQHEPEDIDRLQAGEQCESDVLANPALVLLCFPVQFKRPDGSKGRDYGIKYVEVQVVTKVRPHSDEQTKVWSRYGELKIVKELRGLYRREFTKRRNRYYCSDVPRGRNH